MDRTKLESASPGAGAAPSSASSLRSAAAPSSGASPRSESKDAVPAERPDDPAELLLWALMLEFERLALERYAAVAPGLATIEKRRFVERLEGLGVDREALVASELWPPVEKLLACARKSSDEVSALLVQGLVLEHLGQAIYRIAESVDRASPATRALAAAGRVADASVAAAASVRIPERVGRDEQLYVVFADVSYEVLGTLDALGEPVDRVFGQRFGLRFADILGEFTADLIGAGTALGMQRRKVVAHLAGACMGL